MGSSRSLCNYKQIQRLSCRAYSKESAITTASSICSVREHMLYYRIKRLIQSIVKSRRRLHHIALFRMDYLLLGRSRSGVGVGVGINISRPESESLKIRQLRSPELNNRDSNNQFQRYISIEQIKHFHIITHSSGVRTILYE